MRHLIPQVVLMLLVLARGAASEPVPEPVKVLPRFKVGDKFEYEVIRWQTDSAVKSEPRKLHWNFTVEVMEVKAGQFVMRCTSHDRFIYPKIPLAAADAKSVELLRDFPVDFVFSLEGERPQARDMDRLRERADKILVATADADPAYRDNPEEREQFLKSLRRIYGEKSGAVVMSLFGRDFIPLYSVYGVELEVGKPLSNRVTVPSPFGGEPLSAKSTIHLEAPAKGGKDHRITTTVELDGEGVANMAKNMLKRFADNSELMERAERELKDVKLNLTTKSTYRYDSEKGIITHATIEAATHVGGREQAVHLLFQPVTNEREPSEK